MAAPAPEDRHAHTVRFYDCILNGGPNPSDITVGAQAAEILDAARESAARVAALIAGDRKAYIAQAAQALEQFQAQQKKLGQLAKGAGRRASVVIQDSMDEIIALHAELARNVSAGLGLRSARS